MPTRQRQPRIAWPVVVLAAAAVIGGVIVGIGNLRSGDVADGDGVTSIDRTASVSVAGEAAEVGPTAPPAQGWSIRYLVNAVAADSHLEVVTVHPPFDARIVVHEGREASTPVISERELGLGLLATSNRGAEPAVLAPEPTPAGPRPAAILDDAVRLGLAERRERRRVAGRVCQVYRTSGARDGSIFLPPDDPDDILDLCVDNDGLLLEEWQVFNGEGIRQRVALSVEAPKSVDPAALRQLPAGRVVPAREGGGSLRPVEPGSRPQGSFFEVEAPPPGFSFSGRFGAVPPQPGFNDPDQRGRVFATTVDVFVRGADAVIVEVGGTLDLSVPWEPEPGSPRVDLGAPLEALGQAEVVLGLAGGELRALVGDSGRFVKVRGTVSVAQLEQVMRSLRPHDDGAGLVFLDG